jgi:hypothetical protein
MNAPLPLLPWGFTLHIKHLEKFPSVFRGHLMYMNIFLRKRRDITYLLEDLMPISNKICPPFVE